jgi:hypothetical protein
MSAYDYNADLVIWSEYVTFLSFFQSRNIPYLKILRGHDTSFKKLNCIHCKHLEIQLEYKYILYNTSEFIIRT